MSPDKPTQALRAETESRFKSLNGEVSQLHKDIAARAKWCNDCRRERRDAETKIVAATNELAMESASFQAAITRYINRVDVFILKSLTMKTPNGRK